MSRPKRTITLHVNVLISQREWLRDYAEKAGLTESEIVRWALEWFKAFQEGGPDAVARRTRSD
jgi:hypothetical protein